MLFRSAMAAPDEYLEVSRGCILNLLTGTLPSGMPPKMALPNGTFFYKAQPLPIHAQFAWMLCKRSGDYKWIEPFWDRLVAIRKWYDAETVAGGYYVWLGFQGNGIDNNPAVYGRPPKTSAGVDLAVWHWRENLCMAQLANALNKDGAAGYKAAADELLGLIRTFYWDPSDGFFYAIDRNVDEKQISQQSITWPTHLKFRNCSSLFPVFMGAASEEQAEAVFKRMMDPSEFLSPAGIRSHSAREGLYNNVPMGNPSNWQGPVWALTTCLCSYGLARYGRVEEAKNVAGRLISTYAADLQANKCLHEYYHGDTGQPLSKPEFLSWNLLAARISKDLESGVNPLSIDAV